MTTFRADGRPYHAAGASDAQELAAVLATLVTQIRAMTAAGLAVPAAVQAIAVNVAADTDQFGTIVKLRALRRLMWRVADACGAGDAAGRIEVTAETATRMLARRDPWVNVLRTTVATAAAALGGAHAVTVQPFTAALGRPDAFARRMARNTQIVLMEEASLGRVADPAGGSWFVERATDDLARAAWRLFQEIEAEGGLVAVLRSGHLQNIIQATAATRSEQLATGRLAMTGVSSFPKLGPDGVKVAPWPPAPPVAADHAERITALPARRLAAPYEDLRDRADCAAAGGRPPRIFVANLGTLADFNGRATWIANYLAAGGIEALSNDGFTQSADVGRAFAESGADAACICATDAIYAELAEATASLLKTAGAKTVCLAGRPKDQEAALQAAGVDLFIQAGSNAPDVLSRLHDLLGTPG
jgi:methylmalonyl-CoA mutase